MGGIFMKEQSEQDFIVEKFSYESLEKLSKAELIDIVYRLQDALVDLRVTVCGYAQIGMHKPLYEIARNIENVEEEMREAARNLDFERAMELRDILFEMKSNL